MGLLILGYAFVFLGLPAIVGGALVGFLVALDRPGTLGQGVRGGIAGAIAGTILGMSALYYAVGAIWPGWVGALVGALLWSAYWIRKPGNNQCETLPRTATRRDVCSVSGEWVTFGSQLESPEREL